MLKNIALVMSIVFCFILAGVLVQNFRAQSENSAALAKLQKQMDAQSAAPGSPPAAAGQASPHRPAAGGAGPSTGAPLVIEQGSPLPTEYARRQKEVQQVMDEGWKEINQRSPEQAEHAAELFQAAINKIDDKNADLYNGLGRALLISGKAREAIIAWRAGLALNPKIVDMQSGIGWAYWRLNDPCRAKQAWEAALARDPKSLDAWSAMAWIDLALDDIDDSKRGFQALIASNREQRSWLMGLSMAKARNTDLTQIQQFFRLPELSRFKTPLAVDPAFETGGPATSAAPASQPAAM